MNRTTSRHLATSIVTGRWVEADRSRTLHRSVDGDFRDDGHRLAAPTSLTAWVARIQGAVMLRSGRTARNRALD